MGSHRLAIALLGVLALGSVYGKVYFEEKFDGACPECFMAWDCPDLVS
jgi:hypothetical protein